MVAYADLRSAVQTNVAEDTAHAEHVLTLQIGAVAPAEYLYGQAVAARTQVWSQVEFGHVVGTLRIAHVFTVQINQRGAVDTSEVDEGATVLPALRQVEEAHIGTHGIDAVVLAAVIETLAGIDVGRRIGVRIFHVGIDGAVVALHLPVGRNGDGFPARHVEVFLVEVQRALRGFGYKVERPVAVQQQIARTMAVDPRRAVIFGIGRHLGLAGVGQVSGVTHFLVLFKTGFVFPIGARTLHYLLGHAFGHRHRADFDGEECFLLVLQSVLGYQSQLAGFVANHNQVGAVGREYLYILPVLADNPQLRLVRTVVLRDAHRLTGLVVDSLVLEGIEDTETTRQIAEGPLLQLVGRTLLHQQSLSATCLVTDHFPFLPGRRYVV